MPLFLYTQEHIRSYGNKVIDCNLPSIHFDKNVCVIKQEFVEDLHYIANFLNENTHQKLCIIGYDPKSSMLGIKRAEAVVKFLVEVCKVSQNQLEIEYIYTLHISNLHNRNLRESPLDYRVDFNCNG